MDREADLEEPSREDRLLLEIDLRLYSVILEALAEDEPGDATVTAYLRLAYGAGYVDALTEPIRGRLCREHGLRVPRRRSRDE